MLSAATQRIVVLRASVNEDWLLWATVETVVYCIALRRIGLQATLLECCTDRGGSVITHRKPTAYIYQPTLVLYQFVTRYLAVGGVNHRCKKRSRINKKR